MYLCPSVLHEPTTELERFQIERRFGVLIRPLEGLSWHNLGWRLGILVDETLTDLKEALYQWCVEQQRVTQKPDE